MASTTSTPGETHFDTISWLTLTVGIGFVLLVLASTLYILTLPTDGWQISYNASPPLPLANFAGDWPTPLRTGDSIVAVDGAHPAGGEGLASLRLPAWRAGQSLTYTVLRASQRLEIPVTLHRLDTAGIWRSFWFTIKDTPAEWSWSFLAILVFLLRPRNRAARLMFLAFVSHNAVVKLGWAATTISQNFAPAPIFYLNQFLDSFWGYLFFPAIILLALSFPQRIFPLTRWPRAVPMLLFGLSLVFSLIAIAAQSVLLATVLLVADAVLLILAFGAALQNTRRLSHDPVARAQAVWVIFGFALCIIPVLIAYLLDYSGLVDLTYVSWIYTYFSTLILPICLAIAITRYHLLDIYVILRRTLQYTLLTGLLALVYFAGILLLQAVFIAITGQAQDIAIVLSTLAGAALFAPLRLRVQAFIDRRFFRSKYDAEQILVRFSATARAEIALEPLTLELLNVVEETLQPEQMSVWLKSDSNR